MPWRTNWRLPWVPILWSLLPLVALVTTATAMPDGAASVYYGVSFPPDYSTSDVRTVSYQYSPAFALAMQPFQLLTFGAFTYLLHLAILGSLAWLIGPFLAVILALAAPPLLGPELAQGQMNVIVTALLVLAFRWPVLWAPILLVKVTPVVALLYFVIRREWRYLGIAVGSTVAVALAVAVLSPASWLEWFGLLTANVPRAAEHATVELSARVLLALPLLAWGAYSGLPWTVALAVALTQPRNENLWLAVLAIPRLLREAARDAAHQDDAATSDSRVEGGRRWQGVRRFLVPTARG